MEEAARAHAPGEGNGSVRALMKWCGSKVRLLPELCSRVPDDVLERRHVEPFCGSAALFFAIHPEQALLADQNQRLIDTLRSVRDDPEDVIANLRDFEGEHSRELYYETRHYVNLGCLAGALHAAAFLYLNRTCFNGLYRENARGEFNVPMGDYKQPRILDPEAIRTAARALQSARLVVGSFDETILLCGPNDFVYLDPPYEPISPTSNFTAYNKSGFSRKDQLRLREAFGHLTSIGCPAMLSNSDTDFTRDLYEGFLIESVTVQRSVSAGKRERAREIIVRNYDR
jgi:DNA adenine methylase